MKRLLIIFCVLAMYATGARALGGDNYTVIVSLDGLRWDYAEAFDMPFFERMAYEGVKAVMEPAFPSKTFPNHYTLATGLYPDNHGIIGNTFRIRETGKVYSLGNTDTRTDPQYYGGEPIWITAQRQGVKTATVYWVGSDIAIQGQHPTYWRDYLKRPLLSFDERVTEVVNHLQKPEKDRPRLVMCYFNEPDHQGHTHGPISRETRGAIEHLDSLLWTMWARIQAVPELKGRVNLIVTGDHGMTYLDPERTISPSAYLKKEWVAFTGGDSPAVIYAARPEYTDSIVNALQGIDHLRAWRAEDVPEYLHFGKNKNMGEVVALPDPGWLFTDREVKAHTGGHGFDHRCSDMLVAFRAVGPDFKKGYTRAAHFPNVDIYPLLCYLLGVEPAPCDGTVDDLRDIIFFGY